MSTINEFASDLDDEQTPNQSITPMSPTKKRKNASSIWDYISKNEKECICKVNNCSSTFSINSSTRTLNYHLQKVHQIEIAKQSEKTTVGNNEFQKTTDELLLEIIISDCQSFSVVENHQFERFCKSLNKNYKLPCRQTIKNRLDAYYETKKSNIKNIILIAKSKLNVTMDSWTSIAKDPYMAFTAHFVDSDCSPVSILLDLVYFPHPHNAYDVCEITREVLLLKKI